MKNFPITSTFSFLFPMLLLGLITVFFSTVEIGELVNSIESLLRNQEYISNMNWKAYR